MKPLHPLQSALFLSVFLASLPLQAQNSDTPEPLNVLFLMADDLRPELGCYGVQEIHTPHIDRLAASGIVFQNAYCNVPVSGASRASLLTGVYPHYPHRFVHYSAYASKDCPDAIPLSGWFTDHHYYTVSNGKVFHHLSDHADSWSEPPYRTFPDGYDVYWAEYNRWELWQNEASARTLHPQTHRGPFCEWAEVPDTAYDDGKLALKTIADLKRLKAQGKPFFLACGFWKPHLPFNAPKRYWDLYDRNTLPPAPNRFRPEGLPPQVQNSQEIYAYARTTTPEDIYFQQEAKHGYYACVSYLDAQIGKVLDALDELELADHTIVVLFGDHGWHLGEHNFLGKHNLMDQATHIPLIVRVPGMKQGKTTALVELVDLYPTLCELCGLPYPENQLDGTSFVPVLKDLKQRTKETVFIQWQGGNNAVDERYNYAEWKQGTEITHCMLFDHLEDPEENVNRASRMNDQPVILRLSQKVAEKMEYLNRQLHP